MENSECFLSVDKCCSEKSARDGQVEAKGDLAQVRANLAAARSVLEIQVGKNILAIASEHFGHSERSRDFF